MNHIVSQSDTIVQLHELLLYLNSLLKAAHVFIASLNETRSVTKVIAHIANSKIATCFDYDLKGTPCENMADNTGYAVASGVVNAYSDDQLLVDMGIVG